LEPLQELTNGMTSGLQTGLEAWLAQVATISTGLALVALGSAIGGTARFLVSGLVGRRIGETFPWGTMVVNVTGSLAIGAMAAAASRHGGLALSNTWQLGVLGVLGSYTTVSSFSLQTLALARDGELVRSGANILLSLALCLSAAALGFYSIAALLGPTLLGPGVP